MVILYTFIRPSIGFRKNGSWKKICISTLNMWSKIEIPYYIYAMCCSEF